MLQIDLGERCIEIETLGYSARLGEGPMVRLMNTISFLLVLILLVVSVSSMVPFFSYVRYKLPCHLSEI